MIRLPLSSRMMKKSDFCGISIRNQAISMRSAQNSLMEIVKANQASERSGKQIVFRMYFGKTVLTCIRDGDIMPLVNIQLR